MGSLATYQVSPYLGGLSVHHTFLQILSLHQSVIHAEPASPDGQSPMQPIAAEQKVIYDSSIIFTLSCLSFCTPNCPPNPFLESVCDTCCDSLA